MVLLKSVDQLDEHALDKIVLMGERLALYKIVLLGERLLSKKYIDTKQSNKSNNKKTKDKSIT